MKKTIYIHTNNKQILGAYLSKFSIERYLTDKEIQVKYINVDEIDFFKDFDGKTYLFKEGMERTYDKNDLQSFTLTRFMGPELNGYEGMCIVIDPDIFALSDISGAFSGEIDLHGKPIGAPSKKEAWDSSFMLLDCARLKHWNVKEWLGKLMNKEVTYHQIMTIQLDPKENVEDVPRIWDSLDILTPETKLLHTTGRLTQPWKTGLPIDFTINPLPKIFGVIPREPIHKLLGKYPTHYKQHPDKNIEHFFFKLVKEALAAGAITNEIVQKEIDLKHIRPDIFDKVGEIA